MLRALSDPPAAQSSSCSATPRTPATSRRVPVLPVRRDETSTSRQRRLVVSRRKGDCGEYSTRYRSEITAWVRPYEAWGQVADSLQDATQRSTRDAHARARRPRTAGIVRWRWNPPSMPRRKSGGWLTRKSIAGPRDSTPRPTHGHEVRPDPRRKALGELPRRGCRLVHGHACPERGRFRRHLTTRSGGGQTLSIALREQGSARCSY